MEINKNISVYMNDDRVMLRFYGRKGWQNHERSLSKEDALVLYGFLGTMLGEELEK